MASQKITTIYNKNLLSYWLNKKKQKDEKEKQKHKPWFDKDCGSLKRSLKEIPSRISKRPNDSHLIKSYFQEKKKIKHYVRKKQQQYKDKIFNNLIDIDSTNSTEFWNIIDNIKNSDGVLSEKSGNMSHVMRKPVFAICKQQRRRSACASTQTGLSLTWSKTPKTGFLVTKYFKGLLSIRNDNIECQTLLMFHVSLRLIINL